MKYIDFEQATETIGAGNNPNTGDLRVATAKDPLTPGVYFFVSCWEPSAEELAEIQRTGKVFLAVMTNGASGPAPVSMHGFNPFTSYGETSYQVFTRAQIREEYLTLYAENLVKTLEIVEGDEITGQYVTKSGQTETGRGVLRRAPDGALSIILGDDNEVPLFTFRMVDGVSRQKDNTPEARWERLVANREEILGGAAAREAKDIEADLEIWHKLADQLAAESPEIKEKLENYLKHE
jgi:hypothetical protein